MSDFEEPAGICSAVGVVCLFIILALSIVATLILIFLSLNIVNYDEYGIVWDTATGVVDVNSPPYIAGRYLLFITHRFIKYPRFYEQLIFSDERSVSLRSAQFGLEEYHIDAPSLHTRTKEGTEMIVQAIIFYSINRETLPALHMDFGSEFELVYIEEAKHAIYDVVSRYTAQDLQTDRIKFSEDCLAMLKERFSNLHITIHSINIGDIDIDDEIEEAISSKLIAQQVAIREDLMREVHLINAETDVLKHRPSANFKIVNANADGEIQLLETNTRAMLTKYKTEQDSRVFKTLSQRFGISDRDVLEYIWYNNLINSRNVTMLVDLGQNDKFDIRYADP